VPVKVPRVEDGEPREAKDGGGGEDVDGGDGSNVHAALRRASTFRSVAKLSLERMGGGSTDEPPSRPRLGASRKSFPVEDNTCPLFLLQVPPPLLPRPISDDVEWKPKPTLLSNFLEADSGGGRSSARLNSMPFDATTEDDLAVAEIELGVRRGFSGSGFGGGLVDMRRQVFLLTAGAAACLPPMDTGCMVSVPGEASGVAVAAVSSVEGGS